MDFKQTLDESINPLRDAYEIDSEIFDFYKDVIVLIAQEYATECVKASLEKGANAADLIDNEGDLMDVYNIHDSYTEQFEGAIRVNKSSITSPDNIVLL